MPDAEIELIEKVLAEHVLAEWREVSPESYPGADDGRYGRFCSCGQMLDASDMYGSHRAHVAVEINKVVAERLAVVEKALSEARGDRPSGFWSQREWEDWSNDLATLIPEHDVSAYSNPEGAQEGIISDLLAAYINEREAS